LVVGGWGWLKALGGRDLHADDQRLAVGPADADDGPLSGRGLGLAAEDHRRHLLAVAQLAHRVGLDADKGRLQEVAAGGHWLAAGRKRAEDDEATRIKGVEPFLASCFLKGQADAGHALIVTGEG